MDWTIIIFTVNQRNGLTMEFNERKVKKNLKRRTGGRSHSKKLRAHNRNPEGEEVIRVYVEEKLPIEELSSRELIPNEIDGIYPSLFLIYGPGSVYRSGMIV